MSQLLSAAANQDILLDFEDRMPGDFPIGTPVTFAEGVVAMTARGPGIGIREVDDSWGPHCVGNCLCLPASAEGPLDIHLTRPMTNIRFGVAIEQSPPPQVALYDAEDQQIAKFYSSGAAQGSRLFEHTATRPFSRVELITRFSARTYVDQLTFGDGLYVGFDDDRRPGFPLDTPVAYASGAVSITRRSGGIQVIDVDARHGPHCVGRSLELLERNGASVDIDLATPVRRVRFGISNRGSAPCRVTLYDPAYSIVAELDTPSTGQESVWFDHTVTGLIKRVKLTSPHLSAGSFVDTMTFHDPWTGGVSLPP